MKENVNGSGKGVDISGNDKADECPMSNNNGDQEKDEATPTLLQMDQSFSITIESQGLDSFELAVSARNSVISLICKMLCVIHLLSIM